MATEKVLPNVVLLATSHNVAKAYLYRLQKNNLKPRKVLILNFNSTKGRRENYPLRKKLKSFYKKYSFKEGMLRIFKKLFYKKNKLNLSDNDFLSSQKGVALLTDIENRLSDKNIFSGDLKEPTKNILNNIGWEFKELQIRSINDHKLISYLTEEVKEKYIIFCGGGILRKSILNIGKKFIHIHPGKVPEVKGADCLLWSALVENKIGMSAFFMNKGIDTGDILRTNYYSIPKFNVDIKGVSSSALHNVLINYVDPHFRAQLLIELFEKEINPEKWNAIQQNPTEGKQYYFMHNEIVSYSIGKFFNNKKSIK